MNNNYDDHNNNNDHDNDIYPRRKKTRLYIIVFVIIFAFATIASLTLLFTNTDNNSNNVQNMKNSLLFDAVYDPEKKHVIINYTDKSGAEIPVNVEVLGMVVSYRETFSGPQFTTVVKFDSVPKYGWAIHPVVLDMIHPEFGNVQLKTEIYEIGQIPPRIIYATS